MYYSNPEGVSVHDGFPNPATDTSLQKLDLNQLLIWHNVSTFMLRINGSEWQEAGIFDKDIALVDRALKPRSVDLVLWQHEDNLAISRYSSLKKVNQIWGVVTAVIHQYRSKA